MHTTRRDPGPGRGRRVAGSMVAPSPAMAGRRGRGRGWTGRHVVERGSAHWQPGDRAVPRDPSSLRTAYAGRPAGARGTANPSCYAPRPVGPTHDRIAGSGRIGPVHVGRTVTRSRSWPAAGVGPAGAGAPARAAGHRHRARVEGAAAPVGPQLPSDVLVSRELPGRPDPQLHRPLFAP